MIATIEQPVLVLNKSWVPVKISNVQDAIKLLFTTYKNGEAKAKVVDVADFSTFTWGDWSLLRPQDGELFVQGSRDKYKLPRVIILTRYDKMYHRRNTFSRRALYRRDDNTCQYCGNKFGTEDLNIDHVIPQSQNGKNSWTNCVISCIACNTKKANRTPQQAGMKLLREPKVPNTPVFAGDRKNLPKEFDAFVSESYWTVELAE